MRVRIVTPSGLYRETECSILNVKTIDGERGLLSNHMPLVTMLEIGKMNFVTDKGREEFAVAGGMLYFHDNLATLLVDAIESKEDIDLERALSSKKRAEERLAKKDVNTDIRRAELSLKRAINRINVKG